MTAMLPALQMTENYSNTYFNSTELLSNLEHQHQLDNMHMEQFGITPEIDKYERTTSRFQRRRNIIRKRTKRKRKRKRLKKPYRLNRIWLLPTPWVTYSMIVLALEIVVVNSFIIYVFLQKKNITPVTVLLMFLAVSDSITAVIMSVLNLFVFITSKGNFDFEKDKLSYKMPYPLCISVNVAYTVGRAFHFASVLLTAYLCLQKAIVFIIPFTNRFNTRKSVIISCLSIMVSIILYIPEAIFRYGIFGKRRNGHCINTDKEVKRITSKVNEWFWWIIFAIYVLMLTSALLSTIYICFKLTCHRRNLPWKDTTVTQRRHRRSALLVILICAVFILSEMMNVVVIIHDVSPSNLLNRDVRNFFRRYKAFSLEIGFTMNFIVYLLISEQIRNAVFKSVRRLINRCALKNG
ncbi:unnamed protein product [Mytilus coruscus]|uniref:G-protein coupled receptors family 1 profile domain-containing protein n=1 Tax=Mytilus coruscus TaxID=42192 RepID=A0A6J8DZT9_MYTCO|nr:unnamed protein product [Mytilus coruscus]